MKKVFLLLAGSILTVASFAQERNPYPRTITVSGTAETEIAPDEIYVQVDLKEYDKKGGGKIGIEKIRQDFLTAVRSMGLPDSAVTIAYYSGYNGNPWWRKKNKKEELYSSITYQVKLRNSAQVDQLVDKLDDNATQNFFIQRTSYSKLEELKKRLKMDAVRNAKEKAAYLTDAINEKIGEAVTINEPSEFYQPYYAGASRVMAMKNAAMDQAESAPDQQQADFKKIKIKYDVTVVFALK
ncbi:SIMPL domain-containing protein [Flavisolibacter nicotianae]|uniref:SIMPL domain-containing protein n=1 Tax=Flavisolibacter nicotianae TaxID=2364882 RepID=UPI000EB4D129|nr:SIMPL domain-containing protein [Flavisolibacter nicotianae]